MHNMKRLQLVGRFLHHCVKTRGVDEGGSPQVLPLGVGVMFLRSHSEFSSES